MKLAITVPAGNVGDVSSDLSGRRGQMVGMDSAGGGLTTVEAKAPLAEVTTYARTLSSMTGGQGSYTMEFTHYDVVPGNVQQEIIEQGEAQGRGRVAADRSQSHVSTSSPCQRRSTANPRVGWQGHPRHACGSGGKRQAGRDQDCRWHRRQFVRAHIEPAHGECPREH